MAALNVEVTSKDMIKPSKPTPQHLRSFKLSFLDQIAPPTHMPTILYYQNPLVPSSNTTTLLKSSLSETLVDFYPLAGRIIDGGDKAPSFIDCNDQGVVFNEARVSVNLSAVIQDPNLDELIKLLPFAPVDSNNNNLIVTAIQVNYFSCGGIAIGYCASHTIADAFTVAAFLTAWSSMARGVNVDDHFGHDAKFISSADLFPPRDLPNIGYHAKQRSSRIYDDKGVTKRLIFNKEQINALKRQVVDQRSSQVKTPSRSVLVSAYIWKRFIEAARAKPHPPKIFGVRQSVNFRTAAIDRLGNMYSISPIASHYMMEQQQTSSTPGTSNVGRDGDLAQLIGKLDDVQRQVDANFMKRVQNGEDPRTLPRVYSENISTGDVEICGFSSIIWFPFYKVNFGWGEPVWVSMTRMPSKNMVILFPTKCGEGIEAWLFLPQHYVSMLERDSILPSAKPILPRL